MNSVVKNHNPCPFRERVLLKMSRNETINIIVIGGSNTEGMGITEDGKNRFELRWSNLFSKFLNSGWYSGEFKVTNITKGGWSANQWIKRSNEIARWNPDLVITDLTVNDGGESDGSLPQAYQYLIKILETLDKKPAIFNYISFKLSDLYINERNSNIYNYSSIINGSDRYFGYYRFWKMHDFAKSAYDLQVPYASFRNLVYPEFNKPPENLFSIWNRGGHPGTMTHKYMADHIFSSFSYLIKDSLLTNKCHKFIKGKENLFNFCDRQSYVDSLNFDGSIRPVCFYKDIINVMDATKEGQSITTFKMSKHYYSSNTKWIFDEEKPGIDQYIDSSLKKFRQDLIMNDLPKDKILSFQVTAKSAIQLSYLNTYNQYTGGMIVWFGDDIHNSVYIDTCWHTSHSITSTYYILLQKLNILPVLIDNRHGYLNSSSENIVLNIFPTYSTLSTNRLIRIKTKLLGILTC